MLASIAEIPHFSLVRITVDISEDTLDELQRICGEKVKSRAVASAVESFVKRSKAREFGRLIREGAFDYPVPPDKPADGDELSW